MQTNKIEIGYTKVLTKDGYVQEPLFISTFTTGDIVVYNNALYMVDYAILDIDGKPCNIDVLNCTSASDFDKIVFKKTFRKNEKKSLLDSNRTVAGSL